MTATQSLSEPKKILYAAAALSAAAALIHLWVAPEHFEEWWGYGAFFAGAAVAQGAYAAALLYWSGQWFLLLGVAGNSAIVLLYLVTRTLGVPFLGPEAGEVEGVGFLDVCAAASEVALMCVLGGLILWRLLRGNAAVVLIVLGVVLMVGVHVPHAFLLLKLMLQR